MGGVGLYGRPRGLHQRTDWCVQIPPAGDHKGRCQGDSVARAGHIAWTNDTGGTAGDHKGPPRIHPTTLAPTESWMCALG